MRILKTVEEYNKALEKLIELMNAPIVSSESEKEVSILLDRIDSYNGMDFLKVDKKK